MKNDFPFFKDADVSGFTIEELDYVAQLAKQPGWKVVQKFLDAVMEPVGVAVYANTDPDKQLLLHHGIGMIYVAQNLTEFVSSAKTKADRLLQQEESAKIAAEQPNENEV